MKTSQSAYERGLWNLLEGRFHLFKIEPRKAIPFFKECKDFFIQDGRDLEILWSIIWLTAAYDQAGQKEEARAEIREFLSVGTNPDHALLMTLRQASSWFKDLQ
jgi:hypothetical protein